jgi:hypothetical protein
VNLHEACCWLADVNDNNIIESRFPAIRNE